MRPPFAEKWGAVPINAAGRGSGRACAAGGTSLEITADHGERAHAAPDHRRHDSHPSRGCTPDSKLAELVRSADEHGIHRAHATADRSPASRAARACWRTNTLTMSPAPAMPAPRATARSWSTARTMIVQTPNNATPPNIQRPACRWIGRMPSQNATMAAPTPGAARSIPRPTRADVQNRRSHTPATVRRRRRTARRRGRARSRRAPVSSARRTRTLRGRRASATPPRTWRRTGRTPSIMNIATDQQCTRDAVRPVDAEDQRDASDGRAADRSPT